MALTFEAQVEALTSFSIDGSSTPTQTELSQFLVDGVLDVTFKWLAVKPQDVEVIEIAARSVAMCVFLQQKNHFRFGFFFCPMNFLYFNAVCSDSSESGRKPRLPRIS